MRWFGPHASPLAADAVSDDFQDILQFSGPNFTIFTNGIKQASKSNAPCPPPLIDRRRRQ
jgi:hypothetical protein